jgi:NAD(P)-dependent dehydrogenase (short-subunit alcohol dehydrogenase family)
MTAVLSSAATVPRLQAFSLKGRVAVVTGALGLLGRHHLHALSSAGAHVVVVDLHGEACAGAADATTSRSGVEALGCAADITKRESLLALREAVLSRFDRLDVLVNNAALDEKVEAAGALAPVPFEEFPLAAWQRALDVNVTGTFLACQVLGSEMARRGYGSIVNIASTYGVVAPDQSLYRRADGTQTFYKSAAYPTSKGAVVALTRYLAAYWGRQGVRVNALSPGGVENGQGEDFVARYSERTPLGRMASPSDYEGALVFLASDASAYVTGANLMVDGGWTAW